MSTEEKIFKAPEFNVHQWIDENGEKTNPIKLSDFKGKFKVVYCFQSACMGCHSKGFPALKNMVEALGLKDNIQFLAVQTVFESFHLNTYKNMVGTQKLYELKIPFGHDAGIDGKSQSQIMTNYKTRGTPWFIFIDKHDNVVYEDFSLNTVAAIEFLSALK